MGAADPIDGRLARAVVDPLPAALRGDEEAARRYVRSWRTLVRALLDGHPAPPAAADVLDQLAVTAPFTRGGSLAALVSAAATMMPDMASPTVSHVAAAAVPEDALAFQRFARIVQRELAGAGTGLERWMAAWQLSVTDVGHLFGVARQAVQQWLDAGVPPARQPKLAVVSRIATLLERNLQINRIPAVVRTEAPTYGGRSILQAIADGDEDDVLSSLERAFDWSVTA